MASDRAGPVFWIFILTIYKGPTRASLVAETVKNPPAMQETWVRSLGQEDPLEEGFHGSTIRNIKINMITE